MSGGVRNIHVYDCNFLGTDIGIRFKTTRGRGGVVEKISINNIRMNNIGGAAILFDMYYMAVDPLTRKDGDVPSATVVPVNEGTPQFRDIRINEVHCKGAETAIYVRGLPEMNVKNLVMENINIESQKGFVCIEGQDITLRNAVLLCREGNAVEVHNGKDLTLDNVQAPLSDVLIGVSGGRSRNIRVLNGGESGKEVALSPDVAADAVKFE